MQKFNGTTCRTESSGGARARSASRIRRNEVSRTHEPKANRVDDMGIPTGILINCDRRSQLVRMWPSLRLGHMSDCDAAELRSGACLRDKVSQPQAVSHISNKCRTEGSSFMRNPFGISHIARRPVSALWTTNYTTSSSEAMNSGNRYYWKVRALDGGGEQ